MDSLTLLDYATPTPSFLRPLSLTRQSHPVALSRWLSTWMRCQERPVLAACMPKSQQPRNLKSKHLTSAQNGADSPEGAIRPVLELRPR